MSRRGLSSGAEAEHERFLEIILELCARLPPDVAARLALEEQERAQARENELRAIVVDPHRRDAHLTCVDGLLFEELGVDVATRKLSGLWKSWDSRDRWGDVWINQ